MALKDRLALIKSNTYFPKYSKWGFFILVFCCCLIYNYQSIFYLPPQGLHQWRQCDCLSITLNYYQDGNAFLAPSVHNLAADGTGKTISEFPLFYFVVAQLWAVFGYHEIIYRILNFLIFLCGLFALFKIFENILKDSILAISFSLLLFTSPMLVYYANNFLMNSTALSLAFIALYFFYRFYVESKNKYLYAMAFFFALAGLLKATSLLSFLAIFGVFIAEILNVRMLKDRKIFQHPKSEVFPMILVLLIQVVWYLYSVNYNAKHNSGIFLIGILPIWDLNKDQIKVVVDSIWDHIHWDYFRRETQVLFALMFMFLLARFKKADKLLMVLTTLVVIGVLLFVVLFFQALKDHDYYALDMLILIPCIILTFFIFLKNSWHRVYNSLLIRIFIIAFLIHNIDFARRRIQDRYDPGTWYNKDGSRNVKTFEGISEYLRSIGVKKQDRVIVLPDRSINVSLYLMDQKGWTGYGLSEDNLNPNFSVEKFALCEDDPSAYRLDVLVNPDQIIARQGFASAPLGKICRFTSNFGLKIKEQIGMGAKYLLVYDKSIQGNKHILPFTQNKIGSFKSVDIYKL